MAKRGTKPKGKVKIKWSPDFAYAIGLIASDGCLYSDGRHINLTSKDYEIIVLFKRALGLHNKIGKKSSGAGKDKKYFVIQFGDVLFYRFLISIGVTPAKSKTIKAIKIPNRYFFDFLRGVFDGDGSSYSYWDKRWRSSYMFYLSFVSANEMFLKWVQQELKKALTVNGYVSPGARSFQLKYAKKESLKIIQRMYYSTDLMALSRKRTKIEKTFVLDGAGNESRKKV